MIGTSGSVAQPPGNTNWRDVETNKVAIAPAFHGYGTVQSYINSGPRTGTKTLSINQQLFLTPNSLLKLRKSATAGYDAVSNLGKTVSDIVDIMILDSGRSRRVVKLRISHIEKATLIFVVQTYVNLYYPLLKLFVMVKHAVNAVNLGT